MQAAFGTPPAAHSVHGNVTLSHLLQVEDKGEKLQGVRLLSVSGIVFEKNTSPQIFINLQPLPSLKPICTFNCQDFLLKTVSGEILVLANLQVFNLNKKDKSSTKIQVGSHLKQLHVLLSLK